MPSGPELSNTRLTTLPPEGRLRLFFDRERDLDDLICLTSALLVFADEPVRRRLRLVLPDIDCLGLLSGMRQKGHQVPRHP